VCRTVSLLGGWLAARATEPLACLLSRSPATLPSLDYICAMRAANPAPRRLPDNYQHILQVFLNVLLAMTLLLLIYREIRPPALTLASSPMGGMSVATQAQSNPGTLLATTHGAVLHIHVKEGDTVSPGQSLITFAATSAAPLSKARQQQQQEQQEDDDAGNGSEGDGAPTDASAQLDSPGSQVAPEIRGSYCDEAQPEVRRGGEAPSLLTLRAMPGAHVLPAPRAHLAQRRALPALHPNVRGRCGGQGKGFR
jgi:hypothetical protein